MPRPQTAFGLGSSWRKTSGSAMANPGEIFRCDVGKVHANVIKFPDNAFVFSTWFNDVEDLKVFKRTHRRVFDILCSDCFAYWIADLRFATTGFRDAEYWFVNKLTPALFRAGLKRQAIILPDAKCSDKACYAHEAVSKTLEIIDDHRVQGFVSIPEARQWVLQD